MIRQRDLERGVDRLGARIGEEHMVEPRGRDPHQGVGQLERRGMAHLERRRVVHDLELLGHGLRDFLRARARR